MKQYLAELGTYPIREKYSAYVKDLIKDSFIGFQNGVQYLVEMTHGIEQALTEYKQQAQLQSTSLSSEWLVYLVTLYQVIVSVGSSVSASLNGP